MNAKLNESDVERVEMLHAKCAEMKKELAKRVVGQDEMVDQVLTAVFARGHALLTGVPGLAKTLLVRTLAEVMDLGFKRVQFTPDLMPADITGTEVLDEDRVTGKHVFRFVKGPVFTNLLLADEINRTPPKTQAALLEAMQEHSVTVGGETYQLAEPFFVLATQNPIEQEGTYPLPEAQRGAARPFLLQHQGRLSFARRGVRDHPPADGRGRFRPCKSPLGCGDPRTPVGCASRSCGRPRSRIRRRFRARDTPEDARGAGVREGACKLGRRPARGHGPRHGGEVARCSARARLCDDRRRQVGGSAGDEASHSNDFQRRSRRRHYG